MRHRLALMDRGFLASKDAPFSPAPVLVLCALLLTVEAAVHSGLWRDARVDLVIHFGFRDRMEGIWPPQTPDYRLLSYLAVHGTPRHTAMNVTSLILFGLPLCRRVGAGLFLLMFATSGAAAALFFAAVSPNQGLLIGASGAIYGLIGAGKLWEGVFLAHSGGPWLRYLLSFLFFISLNLLATVVFGWPVAWEVHVAGAGIGGVLALLYLHRAPPGRMVI
ncbi:MAG: rhomboid family intramembrane serine protease [Pseudomonadota bacterium]